MNIACDARSLVGRRTGVATWLTEVAAGRARRHGRNVSLAASKPFELPDALRSAGVRQLPPPGLPIPGTLWLHTLLPHQLARCGADVFIAALAVVPRRCPVPAVAMVHDITPRTHPHHHTLANRFCFNAYLEESLERAAAVVAGSAATEAELLEQLPFVRAKLACISYGVDGFFSPPAAGDDGSATRDRFASGRRYLLHLGTLEPRKGLVDLVRAYERLRGELEDPPELVIAGAPGWGTAPIMAAIEASPVRRHIHLPGYVTREQARELLRSAEVFVLASEAEGFGLPLAEAISCGTPAVASDIPALREAGGDAALFTPPADPTALAAAIGRALEPEVAGELRRRAAARAPGLRWEPVVDAWDALLERVVADAANRA
jgi:glycosyltransferase involved in cell wall biosynthesis